MTGRRPDHRPRAGRAVLVVLLVLLAGCGRLPHDSAPRPIDPAKVPDGLLESTTVKPGSSASEGPAVGLYFLAGDHLQRVDRSIVDPTPAHVLDALLVGTVADDPQGLSSAIPSGTTVVATARDGATLVVTLSGEILSATGVLQKSAFAQIVYTATGLAGVDSVRFRAVADNGSQADLAPTTDNGSKAGPLVRGDFSSLAPP